MQDGHGNPNAKDCKGRIPLWHALENDDLEIINMFAASHLQPTFQRWMMMAKRYFPMLHGMIFPEIEKLLTRIREAPESPSSLLRNIRFDFSENIKVLLINLAYFSSVEQTSRQASKDGAKPRCPCRDSHHRSASNRVHCSFFGCAFINEIVMFPDGIIKEHTKQIRKEMCLVQVCGIAYYYCIHVPL